jgi:hypothetical protein
MGGLKKACYKYRVIKKSKVSGHLMIMVKNKQKYFKQFQSLTMVMWLELGVTDAMQNTVFENTVQLVNKCLETGGDTSDNCNFLYCNYQVHRDFLITLYK